MEIGDALRALQQDLGPRGFLGGTDIDERYLVDIKGRRGAVPLAVLRPAGTAEVARALKLCHAAEIPVVTQGGRTGLVLSHLPQPGEVVLSMERMNAIEEIDADAAMARVQCGAVLQAIQDRVAAAGLLFPLDLGARGSCTIGGNISTNAGGNRVIRYGMTRELIVGLEAVLADGTVLDGLKPVIKNNTGVDLKHLFIGTEGIMGVVTRAILRLVPRPAERNVALCALPSFGAVRALLRQARQRLGGELTAFEVMWDSYFSRAVTLVPKTPPLAPGQPYYALVEASSIEAGGAERLERLLHEALEAGVVSDAVIAKSGAEVEAIWKLRDLSVEVNSLIAPLVTFDVSLPIADMERFVPQFQDAARAIDARCETIVYGHLGDGNLHLTVHQPAERPETVRMIQEAVYALVGRWGGSISAEHGIGVAKRDFLPHSRSRAEIAAMHALKNALDPKHLLNRGRILEHPGP